MTCCPTIRLPALVLVLAATAAPAWVSAAPGGIVVMPFQNLSSDSGAATRVRGLMQSVLAERGYRVVSGDVVASFLEARRIRWTDSLERRHLEELLSQADADRVLFGSVFSHHPGAAGDPPRVAVGCRMVDRMGRTLWWETAGLSPENTIGVLGRGLADSLELLSVRTVRELAAALPHAADRRVQPRSPASAPFHLARPRDYRAPELLDRERKQRVVLLPLFDLGDVANGPHLFEFLVGRRLRETGRFDPVEPADFRAALRMDRIATVRDLDPVRLTRLVDRLGVQWVLWGTIYGMQEQRGRQGIRTSRVEVKLVLVDPRAGHVLWLAHHEREGTDYNGLFERGALTTTAALARQTVDEMLGRLDLHAELPEPEPLTPFPLAAGTTPDPRPVLERFDFSHLPRRGDRGEGPGDPEPSPGPDLSTGRLEREPP